MFLYFLFFLNCLAGMKSCTVFHHLSKFRRRPVCYLLPSLKSRLRWEKILTGVEVHAGLEQFARWAVCSVRLRLRVASAVRILVLMLLANLTHSAVFFCFSWQACVMIETELSRRSKKLQTRSRNTGVAF